MLPNGSPRRSAQQVDDVDILEALKKGTTANMLKGLTEDNVVLLRQHGHEEGVGP